MNWSESFVLEHLKRNSAKGEWKFFEVMDKTGKSMPQAKFYSQYGYWVAYPDFELVDSNKLMLLVEVKGYDGYFHNRDGVVGMKYRNFKSYQKVRIAEGVDVRICFVLSFPSGTKTYWETIDDISYFDSLIEELEYSYYDIYKKCEVSKKEKFIFWNTSLFLNNLENISN